MTPRQLALFEAGCANPHNTDAQVLVRTLEATNAVEVLERIPGAPLEQLVPMATHFWRAVKFEAALFEPQNRVETAVVSNDHERYY